MNRLIPFLFLALPIAAQQVTDARSYVPPDYRCEAAVDFVALRECGLWDHLQRSYIIKLIDGLQSSTGIRLEYLDRLRAYPETPGDEEEGRDEERRSGGIVIFEGNEEIGLPVHGEGTHLKAERVGNSAILVEDYGWNQQDPDVYVCPRPGLLVYGTRHLVAPVLEGKAKPGVPPPEFLSLTSGRGNLAHLVVQFSNTMLSTMPEEIAGLNPSAEDPLRHLMVRVRQIGEGDDATFELQGTLRFHKGDKAPALAEQWLRDKMKELEKHPQVGALKRYWRKIQFATDGRDVNATLALGDVRKAAGEISNLIVPLMAVGFAARPVATAEAVIEIEEVPPPVKPKTEKPGGGKENEKKEKKGGG